MRRKIIKIDEAKCTGCGLCAAGCHEGAIKIIGGKARLVSETYCDGLGACLPSCPSGALSLAERAQNPAGEIGSELSHWPVQLKLANPDAPCFDNADLLIAADCVTFAFADFHRKLLRGKKLVIFCPKLDGDTEVYVEKLAALFKNKSIKSVSLAHMEVPCCFGLARIVAEAQTRAATNLPVSELVISLDGEITGKKGE
ncbi:MAG: 4Fe-4S binding protein [Elusimicrobiales bacterium]|nr:4Fe-4S binding protein [Elusimicrobiales bacterium]